MRLIDADALRRRKELRFGLMAAITTIQFLIDEAPTVEECKHGHWEGGGAYYCSNCNAYSATDVFGGGLDITEQHYCYNCGAIMDGQSICDD
jgi:hypothetical protein